MNTISVRQEKCTKCMHCVQACPTEIFVWDKAKKEVGIQRPEWCIACGHCVAACESDAVSHSSFGEGKVHPVDSSLYPSAEQMMTIIRGRRSNRAFSTKPVPAQMLDAIVEAAYRAPTASNEQEVEFTLITSADKLKVLSDFTMNTFGGLLKLLDNGLMRGILGLAKPELLSYIPMFKEMQAEYEQGRDGILRNAKAVLLIHTPHGSRFGEVDSNLAYQNASLMAESLGVSQFYTGFVLNATKQKKGKLEQLLGIEGTIQAGMAMGMPLFKMKNYIDKKPMRLNRL